MGIVPNSLLGRRGKGCQILAIQRFPRGVFIHGQILQAKVIGFLYVGGFGLGIGFHAEELFSGNVIQGQHVLGKGQAGRIHANKAGKIQSLAHGI